MALLIEKLKPHSLILASGSPRRSELLSSLNLPFKVELPQEGDEGNGSPEELSLNKSNLFKRQLSPEEIVITADTLVFCDGERLGKPNGREEAVAMLQLLSGRAHQVTTGVTIRSFKAVRSFSVTTKVLFKELSLKEIEYYVDNYQPYDKAGGYGAQEWIGMVAIEAFEGCYYNVIGLPVAALGKELLLFIENHPIICK